MALRSIIYTDNPMLREKSHRVRRISPDVEQLVDDMFETMEEARGVGLAAIQVAIPMRVITVKIPEDMEDEPDAGMTLALVNPELARTSDEMEDGVEGCLSIPGYIGMVPRHSYVTVKALDMQGKKVRIRADGYLARVLQHEIDHLDGVLFTDHASEIWTVQEGEEEAAEVEANSGRGAGGDLESFME